MPQAITDKQLTAAIRLTQRVAEEIKKAIPDDEQFKISIAINDIKSEGGENTLGCFVNVTRKCMVDPDQITDSRGTQTFGLKFLVGIVVDHLDLVCQEMTKRTRQS